MPSVEQIIISHRTFRSLSNLSLSTLIIIPVFSFSVSFSPYSTFSLPTSASTGLHQQLTQPHPYSTSQTPFSTCSHSHQHLQFDSPFLLVLNNGLHLPRQHVPWQGRDFVGFSRQVGLLYLQASILIFRLSRLRNRTAWQLLIHHPIHRWLWGRNTAYELVHNQTH